MSGQQATDADDMPGVHIRRAVESTGILPLDVLSQYFLNPDLHLRLYLCTHIRMQRRTSKLPLHCASQFGDVYVEV